MKRKDGKYILKESELRKIIREAVILEVYNPDDFKGLHTAGYKGSVPTLGDSVNALVKLITGLPSAIVPDSMKERAAAGDNKALQWILGLFGAQKAGTAGGDVVPDWHRSKFLGGNGVGTGKNADAHQQFNVAAACQWLRANANRTTTKWCAKYVRMAMNRGGLDAPFGMNGRSAKNYLNILPANGWDVISPQEAGEPGDVIVINACSSINGKSNYPNGHIAMCIGNGQWASDFIQRTPQGLANPVPQEFIRYFRYRNRV